MEFINQAVTVLQTLVVALGAGLAVWGVVNLMEGYGNDNPGANTQSTTVSPSFFQICIQILLRILTAQVQKRLHLRADTTARQRQACCSSFTARPPRYPSAAAPLIPPRQQIFVPGAQRSTGAP